jgi:hypothetical protein
MVLALGTALVVVCSCMAGTAAARHLVVGTQFSWLPRDMVIRQMSCPSADLCVGSGDGEPRNILYYTIYSTDPSVGSSWKFLPDPPSPRGVSFPPDSPVTCPSTNLCLVVDDPMSSGQRLGGQVFAIRNPAQAGERWKLVGGGYVSHVLDTWPSMSCPTAGFCAELDEKPASANGKNKGGAFWVSAHPAIPGSWHQRALPFSSGGFLVCASGQLCVAYRSISERVGQVSFIRDPLNSTSRWHRYTLPLPRSFSYIGSVSCTSSGGCIMIGGSVPMGYQSAGILMSSDIQRGPASWIMSPEGRADTFASVGCLQDSTCYATMDYGSGLVISPNPFSRTRAAWRSTAANISSAIATPSLTTCATRLVCFDAAIEPTRRNTLGQEIETLRLSY